MKLKALQTPYHFGQVEFTDFIYVCAIEERTKVLKKTKEKAAQKKILSEITCMKNRLNKIKQKRVYNV